MIRDPRPLFLAIPFVLFAACSPSADIKTPPTGNTGGKIATVTGRVDTSVTGAASVASWRVEDDGSQTVLTTGTLNSDGTYSLDVPPDETRAVIAALDADGNMVADAVIATTGPADGTVAAPPLDAETTLEASLFIDMVAAGTTPDNIDVVDLRLRLDATLAADVAASTDPAAATATLATAVAAAQATLLTAYGRGSASVTADSLFTAEMADATTYDASLDAGDDAATAASALFDAMVAERLALGVGVDLAWAAEAQAGIALRLVVASGLRGTPPADAIGVSSGAFEARLAGAEATSIAAGAGDDATNTLAATAVSTLETDMAASTDAATSGRTWSAFRLALIGPSDADTVLTGVLGANADAATLLARTSLSAGTDLDSGAGLAVSNALSTAGTPAAVAVAVADVWSTFRTAIDTTVAAGLTGTDTASPIDTTLPTALLVLAAGSFRASS